jgi:Permuted papain-like amidase enzyme, YaeF/YiiX, C92 family
MSGEPNPFNDIEKILVPGDAIVFHHTGLDFVADGIMWFENGNVSHVAVYVGDGCLVEALEKGVAKTQLSSYFDTKHDWCIRRVSGMTMQQEKDLVAKALTLVGDKYDYWQLFTLMIFSAVKKITKKSFNWLVGNKVNTMICSEVFAVSAVAAGLSLFNVDVKEVMPQTILECDKMFTVKEVQNNVFGS